ncbi:MAG: hypothetical protein AB7P76_01250 [Candidatus Melainabacteria bacterium]
MNPNMNLNELCLLEFLAHVKQNQPEQPVFTVGPGPEAQVPNLVAGTATGISPMSWDNFSRHKPFNRHEQADGVPVPVTGQESDQQASARKSVPPPGASDPITGG